jgi:hypothetical protein
LALRGGLALLAASVTHKPARAAGDSAVAEGIEGLEDFWIAVEAYVYGYSLVTMEMTRRVMTNVVTATESQAPMGQFAKARSYPDASFRTVTAPNADTLYTTAWIDVGAEPWVMSLPDMLGRYFLFPMLDGWTNVFHVPGTRTTGTEAQTYAITGPSWSGTLPAGVIEYKSMADLVWLLGRIYCTGTPEDYTAVYALQDACQLTPLGMYGKPYIPPAGSVDPNIDMNTAVRDQVDRMDAITYFTLLAQLLKANPPLPGDGDMVAKMARVGIVPGQDFDRRKFNVDFAKRVPQVGFDRIMLHYRFSGGDIRNINGWSYTTKTGVYGRDYIMRALIAAIGLGANRPQDAIYPVSKTDADGRAYDGKYKYVLHFGKDQIPPVKRFWSLTMYDENYFFVPNRINRYAISPRQAMRRNQDGSLDLYIQAASPGVELESNWLPAPDGRFQLMMRLYWPDGTDPTIFDGTWKIPAVRRVGAA